MDKVLLVRAEACKTYTGNDQIVWNIYQYLSSFYEVEFITPDNTKSDKFNKILKKYLKANNHQLPKFCNRIPKLLRNGLWHINNKRIKAIRSILKYFNKKRNERFVCLWKSFDMPKKTNSKEYKYIVSEAWPPSSHLVTLGYIRKQRMKYDAWIQIWLESFEQGKKLKPIQKFFEYQMLKKADRILYADHFLLQTKQKEYGIFATKMQFMGIPYPNNIIYDISVNNTNLKEKKNINVAYFGSWKQKDRNIMPLYNALSEMKRVRGYFWGWGDCKIESNGKVTVSEAIPYEKISQYTNEMDIIAIVMNKVRLIPGKLYDVSRTNKYVMVLCDGDNEYKKSYQEFFSKYQRFIFCENKIEDIKCTISSIIEGEYGETYRKPIADFNTDRILTGAFQGMLPNE